ncbi:MAG: metal ABC transporter substrate-binding protein [Candidatus Krumholzibacteria bacterium]|nr:metal ABC transporter substrate-binding protein [Candidatus Krumholzibacteria bacterium]
MKATMKRTARLAVAVVILVVSAVPALAKVKVVATISDLGSLVEIVGGDEVEVTVLCPGDRDPHFLPAKPSLARKLGRADLLVYNGLELEIGWLPLLIGKARNPAINPGTQGDVDCSAAVTELLEVPTTQVDRSEGDVHPMGNPHYTLDPRRAVLVANYLAERLGQIDGQHAAGYQERAEAFGRDVATRTLRWKAETAPTAERPVIIYHRTWAYLVDFLQLDVVGEIEHRPGISPSPRHVQRLIEQARQLDDLLVVSATWDHHHVSTEVAERAGGVAVVLPAQTGAGDETGNYLDHMDTICRKLAAAGKSGQ